MVRSACRRFAVFGSLTDDMLLDDSRLWTTDDFDLRTTDVKL
jgi:hypothetical protein